MFNSALGSHNHSSDKPLLGVIALRNEMFDMAEVIRSINDSDSLVDFVWTLDGHTQYFLGFKIPEKGISTTMHTLDLRRGLGRNSDHPIFNLPALHFIRCSQGHRAGWLRAKG